MARIIIILLFFSNGLSGNNDTTLTDLSKSVNILEYPLIVNFMSNPAYTGNLEKPALNLDFQSQLPSLYFNPTNYRISYDFAILKKKKIGMGIGLLYNYYHFYIDKTTTIDLAFSIKIKFNEHTQLSLGTSVISYNNKPAPEDNRTYGDMLDPWFGFVYGTGEPRVYQGQPDIHFLDIKTGLWFTHKQFFSGLSLLHFKPIYLKKEKLPDGYENKVEQAFPFEIQFVGGKEFSLGYNNEITPTLEITKKRNLPASITPSFYITSQDKYMMGASYLNLNTLNLFIGSTLFKHLSFVVNLGLPLQKELRELSRINHFGSSMRYKF